MPAGADNGADILEAHLSKKHTEEKRYISAIITGDGFNKTTSNTSLAKPDPSHYGLWAEQKGEGRKKGPVTLSRLQLYNALRCHAEQ